MYLVLVDIFVIRRAYRKFFLSCGWRAKHATSFLRTLPRLVKKPKRMFSPAFMDLPSPAQGLDFSLALTHTQHAWRLKD
jgi:hypothetical protein